MYWFDSDQLSTLKRLITTQDNYVVHIIFKRVNNLIGREPSCQEGRCRIEAVLTRSIAHQVKTYYNIQYYYSFRSKFGAPGQKRTGAIKKFFPPFLKVNAIVGKISIGRVRCLLNIVFIHWMVRIRLFP